jgi:calcineurin-like phosphoesterase family protein
MKYWFTGDTHFHHTNIIKYTNRPFNTIDEMNEVLINNWNNLVNKNDVVFHLGDFDFKYNNNIFNKLNGNKIIIKGNHDKKEIISDIFINILKQKWLLTHNPNVSFPRIIHGHVHGLYKYKINNKGIKINVGVDVWDYKPVELETLIKLINNRGKEE